MSVSTLEKNKTIQCQKVKKGCHLEHSKVTRSGKACLYAEDLSRDQKEGEVHRLKEILCSRQYVQFQRWQQAGRAGKEQEKGQCNRSR